MEQEQFAQVGMYTYRSTTTGKKYSLYAEGKDREGNIVKPFLCLTLLNYDPEPIRIAAIPKETPCLLCNQVPLGHPNYIPEFESAS